MTKVGGAAVLLMAALAGGTAVAQQPAGGPPAPQAPQTGAPVPGPQPQTGAPNTGTQTQQPPTQGGAPAPGTPRQPQVPGAPQTTATGPACPAPVAPAVAPSRAFTGTTGLLLHQVASNRAPDFENLIAHIRAALAKTTNATLRRQAAGWKFYRVAEPGPNGDVLFVFEFDPAVPCVDYALGPILAEAYPDPAQLMEVWKLYEGSVRNGGTLLNLIPVPEKAPLPILQPPTTPAFPGQAPPPVPPPAPSTTPPSAPSTTPPSGAGTTPDATPGPAGRVK